MTTPLRVGLSETLLYDGKSGAGLDGIGVYTRAMHAHLALQPGVSVVPLVMGPLPAAGDAVRRYPGPSRLAAALSVVPWGRAEAALSRHVDVYFATDYRIPRTATVPVCATLFDAIPLSHPQWANPRLRRTKNLLLCTSAQWADRVLAISHAMVSELVEHYRVPAARIAVTPLGVDARWFERVATTRQADACMRHGLVAGYFLFVGTLQPRKNIERIIAAYLQLPAALRAAHQLVIVGKSGWSADALVATLRAAHPAGRIRWLDWVDEADLRALYQAAGAFVFPSLYEGFGLPVLEAFASGVPVVTSNVTSLPEVATGAAVLVDPLDVDAIAAGMRALVEDGELAQRLRASGAVRAREYTWDICAARTVAALRSAVAAA
jgi:glycosyltransferase involved in cell wall biosynthesis